MATVAWFRSHGARRILIALVVAATIPTALFALRAYNSLLLLHSAYEVGKPDVSHIRPWMTLRYLTNAYHVPETALIERLGLTLETATGTTLLSLAQREKQSPFLYVQRVQQAVADAAPVPVPEPGGQNMGWLAALGDKLLAALLMYGYPALALTLLLGAATGLPVPTGLSTTIAGSLAAQGQMSWLAANAVAVTASVVGDMASYGIGRVLGREFLHRRGRWLGYTPTRQHRVELLFRRWGVLTVLLSRTFVSHLSSLVNVLAGASQFPLQVFLPFAILGRLLWASAYLGLGYLVGAGLEPAADFLKDLSGFLVPLAVLAGLGFVSLRRFIVCEVASR